MTNGEYCGKLEQIGELMKDFWPCMTTEEKQRFREASPKLAELLTELEDY